MEPADPEHPARPDSATGGGDEAATQATGSHADGGASTGRLAVLTLTALGVVFGDIGTSPLYALRECFSPHYGLAPTQDNVRGVLSLIVWALILVVSVKYVVFILRAYNGGEGGVMALLALLLQRQHRITQRKRRAVFITIGHSGSALLYGDGMITPAISVLSATEGLAVATPALDPLVLPLTLAVLVLFFWFQHRGTAPHSPQGRSSGCRRTGWWSWERSSSSEPRRGRPPIAEPGDPRRIVSSFPASLERRP